MTIYQTALTGVSTCSSIVTVSVAAIQIKQLGLRGWVRMGVGLGTEVHEAREHLREVVEAAEQDIGIEEA